VGGVYLIRPFVIGLGEGSTLWVRPLKVTSGASALALWLTFSLFAIQLLTWIRTGTLTSPDPLTLLIGALTGNFIYDPAQTKHLIMQLTGIAWLLVSFWTVSQVGKGALSSEEDFSFPDPPSWQDQPRPQAISSREQDLQQLASK